MVVNFGCSATLASKICVTWRKSLRRVWRLPYTTHCYLLPLLSQCLSLEDEISKRSLNFIRECLCNSSRLVSAIANYGIYHGRYNSFLGHNALVCSRKFKVNICAIASSEVNVNRTVNTYSFKLIEEQQMRSANFLHELIFLRDNYLVFSNNFDFSREELDSIIRVICTE